VCWHCWALMLCMLSLWSLLKICYPIIASQILWHLIIIMGTLLWDVWRRFASNGLSETNGGHLWIGNYSGKLWWIPQDYREICSGL
jgi:hypothetical protein